MQCVFCAYFYIYWRGETVMGSADTTCSLVAVPASLPPVAPVSACEDAARAPEQHAARYLQESWRIRTARRRTAHLLDVIQLACHVEPEMGMIRRSIAAVRRHSLSDINAHLLEQTLPHISKRWSLVQARASPAG